MTPPTVNAYYNSSLNEIVFPAGILQPPFFDPTADDAVNYGAIGAVIGHEITHGFDDQGSRSDAEGNLKNWWTAEDRAQFTAKTDKLVKQYDACVAVDDLHVNGKLTLGENIADLGGVTIAYAAYQKSLDGKPAPVIDGFTGPQRFFIGFAQVWRGAIARRRPAAVAADRPALAAAVPHAGAAVEHPGVLRRLRRQAGGQDVSPAGGSRGGVVDLCGTDAPGCVRAQLEIERSPTKDFRLRRNTAEGGCATQAATRPAFSGKWWDDSSWGRLDRVGCSGRSKFRCL